jgi:hypothetical protein
MARRRRGGLHAAGGQGRPDREPHVQQDAEESARAARAEDDVEPERVGEPAAEERPDHRAPEHHRLVEDDESHVQVVADRREEPVEPRPPDAREPARGEGVVPFRHDGLGMLERLPVEPMGAKVIDPAEQALHDVLVSAARGEQGLARHDVAIEPGES